MHTHRNQLFARCWQSCFYYCVCHILFSFFLSAVTRLHKLQRLISLRPFLFFASHEKIAAQWPWFRKSGQGFNRRTLQPTCQKTLTPNCPRWLFHWCATRKALYNCSPFGISYAAGLYTQSVYSGDAYICADSCSDESACALSPRVTSIMPPPVGKTPAHPFALFC